jgi:hypothetical protein
MKSRESVIPFWNDGASQPGLAGANDYRSGLQLREIGA